MLIRIELYIYIHLVETDIFTLLILLIQRKFSWTSIYVGQKLKNILMGPEGQALMRV